MLKKAYQDCFDEFQYAKIMLNETEIKYVQAIYAELTKPKSQL
jgi:hypothetical protein